MALSFARVQIGVAPHFDRPAMRALSKLWLLLAIATVPNILSSWVGVVGYKELSRAFNTVAIALLAACIPYVRVATDALASATPPVRDTRTGRRRRLWGSSRSVECGLRPDGRTLLRRLSVRDGPAISPRLEDRGHAHEPW